MDRRSRAQLSAYPMKVKESVLEAVERQQELYELSCDWYYYRDTQHEYLKKNISYAFFGLSIDYCDSGEDDPNLLQQRQEQEKLIDMLYNKILEANGKRKSIHVGIVFNMLCNIKKKQEKFVSLVPVFKVKLCSERDESLERRPNPSNLDEKIGTTALYTCCVRYIDSEGRIYQNWTDYVVNNTLPKCMMVIPMGGFYQLDPDADNTDEKTYVWLEIGPSPATRKISPYLDVASTVLGFGALGVGLASMAAPILVATPVLVAGTVCGTASGIWTTARSTQQLIDRHEHQQSISPANRTARSAWFGAVGGVVGGIASGSTFLMSRAVRAGVSLGKVTQGTYNTIAAGNVMVNGLGIGNGMYGIWANYVETKEISYLEIGQVVAHVLFFGNAVMKFQTAQNIIQNTQQQVLQEYETSLRSNRHRKAFNRIARNTRASNVDRMTADTEIIRGIRSIQNKDDFFAGVVRNRKAFNSAGAEVTFKNGYAMINDNLRFDPVELSQQPLEVRANMAGAAEPLNKRSIIHSQPIQMSESVYNTAVDEIRYKLRSVLQNFDPLTIRLVGRFVIELSSFSNDERVGVIEYLVKIALFVVQKSRSIVKRSIDEFIYYIWQKYITPRVDMLLADMNVDVNSLGRNFLRDVIWAVLDQFYDAIEKFLEEIIESWTTYSAVTNRESQICEVCSGYILDDH